ncbi:MAG: Hsp33 family molecular chaperone HslO [Deltaproteobacteria bacterium]|nr:Hsp33 family molecular chaperone HslO [Deltaproteobacteria bacterium]
MITDSLTIAISLDGSRRARISRVGTLATTLCKRHQTSTLGRHLITRGLAATAAFPVDFKGSLAMRKVAMQWAGHGPGGDLMVEFNAEGDLRAYGKHLKTEEPIVVDENGRAKDLLLADGYLSVLFQPHQGEAYRGQIETPMIEIDVDLQRWLEQSAQVPSRLFTLLRVPDDEAAVQATGLLLQTLPGGDAKNLIDPAALEHLPPDAPDFALFTALFDGDPYDVLEIRPLQFKCGCSRERVEASLHLLDEQDFIKMIETDQGAQVDCQFCAEHFAFSEADLKEIFDDKRKATS